MEITNRKLIYSTISVLLFVAVVATVIYSLISNGVFADTESQYYDQVKLFNNLDADKKDEQVNINIEKRANGFNFMLEVLDNRKRVDSIELSGFESVINFCQEPIIEISGNRSICIQGFVGVHSQNIQIISFVNSKLEPVGFITSEGKTLENVMTDTPNFSLVKESGAVTGIYLDNRNYSKNPVSDIVRSHYALQNGIFVFKMSEELNIPEPVSGSGGRIN